MRSASSRRGWGIAVAAFAAVLALSLLVGFIRRLATHYTVTDRRLHIRRGILSRTEQHTTLDRVQNVETHQTLLERVPADRHRQLRHRRDRRLGLQVRGSRLAAHVVAAVDRAQQAAAAAAAAGARRRRRRRTP